MKTTNLLKTAVAILIIVISSASAFASNMSAGTPKPYARFIANTGTLTFYYNDVYDSDVDMNLNDGNGIPVWITNHKAQITKVVFDESFKTARPSSCHSWFDGCINLETIVNLSYLNLDYVSDMGRMFAGCAKVKTIQFSTENTYPSNTTKDFSYMFYGCESLSKLTLMKRPTYKYNAECDMSHMFDGCKSLSWTYFFMNGFYTEGTVLTVQVKPVCLTLSLSFTVWSPAESPASVPSARASPASICRKRTAALYMSM